MQPVCSHLKKKPRKWRQAKKVRHHLLHLINKQRNDNKLGRFVVIYYRWENKKQMTTSQGGSSLSATSEKTKQIDEDEPFGLSSSSTPREKKWTIVKKKTNKQKVDVHLLATNALVIFWRSIFCNTTLATSSVAPLLQHHLLQHCFNIFFYNNTSTLFL